MQQTIQHLKKANRHLHLTGALSPQVLRNAASIAGISIAAHEPLEEHLEFTDPAIWAASKEVTSTQKGLYHSIVSILQIERADNVRHVELSLNPYGMLRRGLDVTAIAAVLKEAGQFGENIGTSMRVKFGVNRKDGTETIGAVWATYDACPDNLRFGIDLNGDERKFPTEAYAAGFRGLARAGIYTTIHAGEFPDLTESLRSAISMQPQRIGHAVAAAYDQYAMSALADENITIETALTSNLKLGAVHAINGHPLPRMLEHGIQVVLGTDDPAFFHTTMSQEYEHLANFGFSTSDIQEFIRSNTEQDN